MVDGDEFDYVRTNKLKNDSPVACDSKRIKTR